MARARYLLVAAISVLATGCGDSTLDSDKLESEIAPGVEEQTGTRDVEVTCPADIEAEEGGEFECGLTAEGGIEAKVVVTQEDDDGNVRWRVARP
jgi:hypothetical protein